MYFLLPLLAVLIWSVNVIVSKLSAASIDPAAISFYRWFLALLVLTPFVLPGVLRRWQAVRAHWWQLMVLASLGMALYQSLAYYAAHTVSASFMGIIASVIPLLTIVLSVPLLSHRPTLGIVMGSLLSFAGLLWLVSGGQPYSLISHGIEAGEWMMLVAAVSYALYGVLLKRWPIDLGTWQSLYMQIFIGVLLLLPNFLMVEGSQLTAHNFGLIAFAGIPASVFAPYLWILAVKHLGAGTASVFMNLAPVFTVAIAVLFLDEQLQAYHLIGGGVTLLGVLLSQYVRTPLGGREKQEAT